MFMKNPLEKYSVYELKKYPKNSVYENPPRVINNVEVLKKCILYLQRLEYNRERAQKKRELMETERNKMMEEIRRWNEINSLFKFLYPGEDIDITPEVMVPPSTYKSRFPYPYPCDNGELTPDEFDIILQQQRGKCAICGRRFTKRRIPTKDHIIPRIGGGQTSIENIQILCRSCNARKNDRIQKSNIRSWLNIDACTLSPEQWDDTHEKPPHQTCQHASGPVIMQRCYVRDGYAFRPVGWKCPVCSQFKYG